MLSTGKVKDVAHPLRRVILFDTMAEFGAHLTGLNSEENQPSIFEVLAQENLFSSLQSAIRYLSQILAERNPEKYGALQRYNSEIHAALGLILEYHYLEHYGASFAENFYGMKRVCPTQTDCNSQMNGTLPKSIIFRSLLSLVGFPYVMTKCESYYKTFQMNKETIASMPGRKGILCRAILSAYPLLHTSWETLNLVYQLAFIFGVKKRHSPLLIFSGVFLKNVTSDDEFLQNSWNDVTGNENQRLFTRMASALHTVVGLSAVCLSHAFSTGIFFLQFLEWWHSSNQSQTSLTTLPVPEPPKDIPSNKLPSKDTCPVCMKPRSNDAALKSSGYVFCYPCIYKYVSQHNRCPVTGFPTRTDSIFKVYKPD